MVRFNRPCGSYIVQYQNFELTKPIMIGPAALGVWFRPKVVRFEHLLDAEEEQAVRRLRAKGHDLHWALETRLRQLERDGWKPVTQWDTTGRRLIFMDHREEIVLLHRSPAKTNKA